MVLGGGTGFTVAANRLRRTYGTGEAEIVVVDKDDNHIYQPVASIPALGGGCLFQSSLCRHTRQEG